MTNTARFLLSASLAVALAACSASPEDRRARADAAFAQGDFAAAKIDLAALHREVEATPETLTMLAKAQLELRDGDGAIVTLERLAALGDDNGQVAAMLADAELLRGRPRFALERVEGVSTPDGARMRALAYIDLDELDTARKEFEAGLGLAGDRTRILADYARFLIVQGDQARAGEMVALAAAEAPDQLETLLAQAMVAESKGDFETARAKYDAVLKDRPGNRAALVGRIAALGELGELDKVEDSLEDIGGDLGDPAIAFLTARLAAEKGDWAEVKSILQRREFALRDDPESDLLYAESLMRTGQENQARARLASLAQRHPGMPRVRVALVQVHFSLGEEQEGRAILQQIANDPNATSGERAILQAARKAGDFPAN